MNSDPTKRRSLPHQPPLGVDLRYAVFFVTVCAKDRPAKPLLPHADQLLSSIQFYHEQRKWFIRLAVIMPDHLHLVLRFSDDGSSLVKTVDNWKRWTCRNIGVEWQRDFFDHRLRNDEDEREKCDYVLMNPVRAGLVEDAEAWPHSWVNRDL